MQSQPNIFVRILVPFCTGIAVLQYSQSTKLNLLLYTLAFINLFLLFIFNYLYSSLKVYHHKKKLALLFYLFFFLLGALCTSTYPDALDPDHFSTGKATFLKICVADEPKETARVLRFKARVISIVTQTELTKSDQKQMNLTRSSGEQLQLNRNLGKQMQNRSSGKPMQLTRSAGLLMVSLRPEGGHFPAISYGQVYLIPARFKLVPEPRNPSEFDSKTWMAKQHIYHQAFLSARELIPLAGHRGSALISFALSLRKKQVELYRKLIKTEEAFAVAATLILGYRAELDADVIAAYSNTGTIHALSVSGMHVAMVYLVLEFALGWMNRQVVLKWLKLCIILTLIWFYTLLTGCSASVLRSAIMLTMLILTKTLHKNAGGYHMLALSAFCLLFNDPGLLWDLGFQLSYLAVVGLIYLQPRIYALLSFRYWPLRQAWSIISVSLAATLFTWPLSIYYFHQFPVYFLLSNLFIALPVALLMYIGLIILLFRFYWLARPFEWLLNLMNHGLDQIARLPYSRVHPIWITETELILLFIAVLSMVAGICERKKYPLFTGLFLLILFQGMLLRDKLEARKQRTMILYSLNRNYAVAFIHSDKAVLVTDLSTGDMAFKYHIQPSLEQRKIKNIIYLPWHSLKQPGSDQIKLEGLHINDHQLRFRNFKILLADSFFNHKKIQGMPLFDAIWVHGSPDLEISKLRRTVRFRKIWIDATNRQSLINKIETDTINFKNSVIVFKQIKASLVTLK